MIMVKLTSKVQKNIERAKNIGLKILGGGVSPDPLAIIVPSALEEPPPQLFSSSYGLALWTTTNIRLGNKQLRHV